MLELQLRTPSALIPLPSLPLYTLFHPFPFLFLFSPPLSSPLSRFPIISFPVLVPPFPLSLSPVSLPFHSLPVLPILLLPSSSFSSLFLPPVTSSLLTSLLFPSFPSHNASPYLHFPPSHLLSQNLKFRICRFCSDSWSLLITGSIARSANCRYLIYSEADFEVFRPAEAIRCTDGGKICPKLWFLANGRRHNEHIQMTFIT